MRIEVGTEYTTKHGKKAVVESTHQVLDYALVIVEGVRHVYYPNGAVISHTDDNYDLVLANSWY